MSLPSSSGLLWTQCFIICAAKSKWSQCKQGFCLHLFHKKGETLCLISTDDLVYRRTWSSSKSLGLNTLFDGSFNNTDWSHVAYECPCLQNGVVLPCVLGVVALQQAAAHGGARTCELGHVEVGEAQLRSRENGNVSSPLVPPPPPSQPLWRVAMRGLLRRPSLGDYTWSNVWRCKNRTSLNIHAGVFPWFSKGKSEEIPQLQEFLWNTKYIII